MDPTERNLRLCVPVARKHRLQALKGLRTVGEPEAKERVFDGETLTGRVRLDGARFRNCSFRKATLVYAGMAGTELSGCSFNETDTS